MKRTVALVILIMLIVPVFLFAEEGKIKVVVEGEEEESQVEKGVPEDGIYIEGEKPNILNKRKIQRKKKTKELKQIIEKSNIEREVMDAIISKIIDIEAELDRQDKTQLYTIIGLAISVGIIILLIVIRDRE